MGFRTLEISQARGLSILGTEKLEPLLKYLIDIDVENVDYYEALAAKEYFSLYHEGLNRRVDDPVNSRLNYGTSHNCIAD